MWHFKRISSTQLTLENNNSKNIYFDIFILILSNYISLRKVCREAYELSFCYNFCMLYYATFC